MPGAQRPQPACAEVLGATTTEINGKVLYVGCAEKQLQLGREQAWAWIGKRAWLPLRGSRCVAPAVAALC